MTGRPTILGSAAPVERALQAAEGAALQAARQFGDAWLTESRSAILVVPSVVARAEFNVLVNPMHPDAARIVVADPQPVVWDERLFLVPHVGQS